MNESSGLPDVFHIVIVAQVNFIEVGNCTEIIEVDVIITLSFPRIAFNTETYNL